MLFSKYVLEKQIGLKFMHANSSRVKNQPATWIDWELCVRRAEIDNPAKQARPALVSVLVQGLGSKIYENIQSTIQWLAGKEKA